MSTLKCGQAVVTLKPGVCSGGTHPPGRTLGMIHGTAKLEHWVDEALIFYSPTHIGVQMESLSRHPDLWFLAFRTPLKGVPISFH